MKKAQGTQTRDANQSTRPPSRTRAAVNPLKAERGPSGVLKKESERAHPNQNNAPPYNLSASTTEFEKGDLSGGAFHQDEMRTPFCQPFSCESLQTAATRPPVTRSTLSELDLNWIMHNVSLRVDVNYDHDLHFMPIQGPSGEQKRQDAKKYWLALATEFQIYQHNLTDCDSCRHMEGRAPVTFKRRLPIMFETLRELLETLVPDRDHPKIVENLDTALLMQQVEKGVLDIVRLSQWIADLLKSHCAPMRDESADEMASKIEEGWTKSNMDLIVDGLEKLFSFLEAMKLDVANHQIRTFRFPLIEDTISFQRAYFSRKLQEGKIRPEASQKWYRKARNNHQKCQPGIQQGLKFEPLGALIHSMLGECTQQEKITDLPVTLAYDRLRMERLQEDVQDIIYLHICVHAFKVFVRQRFSNRGLPPGTYKTLQWRIITIVENDNSGSRSESWQVQIEAVAMEITRAAYVECGLNNYTIPDDDFESMTRYLRRTFTPESYGILANKLHAKLEQMTFTHASIFQDRSPLQISEAQKHWQQSRLDKNLWRADAEDVARRVAHIAVLHWNVWAELVYLEGEGEDVVTGEAMVQDENGSKEEDPVISESKCDSEIESGWTPPLDQMSVVDESGGDLT